MSRYLITVRDNVFFGIEALDDDEDDELLGIDWALIEINDAFATIGKIDGEFTLTNKEEAREFLSILESHVIKQVRDQTAAALAMLK